MSQITMPQTDKAQIDATLAQFINGTVLPLVNRQPEQFWPAVTQLLNQFTPRCQQLLDQRATLTQTQTQTQTIAIKPSANDKNSGSIDSEFAKIAGSQLIVDVNNPRFAIKATNARWGSLYDVLYGTDIIAQTPGLKVCKKYNQARGNHVISYAKDFLDQIFPLESGSHHDVTSYLVYYQHLLAMFPDGETQGLRDPKQFVALSGHKSEPSALVLKNQELHVIIDINRHGPNGHADMAGVDDILIEAALITQQEFSKPEDNQPTIDGYRHWLGLMQGDLTAQFDKNDRPIKRQLNKDKHFTCKDGEDYILQGRALLLARHGDPLQPCTMIKDNQDRFGCQGIIDTLVTALIGMVDLQPQRSMHGAIKNSRCNHIYMVKTQCQSSAERTFCAELMAAVEQLLDLPPNTLKMVLTEASQNTDNIAPSRGVMLKAALATSPSDALIQTLAQHRSEADRREPAQFGSQPELIVDLLGTVDKAQSQPLHTQQ
jgi:malate synthase